MPIEPAVPKGLSHRLAGDDGLVLTGRLEPVHQAAANRRELEKLAGPSVVISQRLWVEADPKGGRGRFARGRRAGGGARGRHPRQDTDADATRHRRPTVAEHTGLQRPQVGQVPTVVFPARLVLVAPVPMLRSVQPGILGQQRRQVSLTAKVVRLLRVKVVDPIAIDVRFVVGPGRGIEQFANQRKRRRSLQVSSSPRQRLIELLGGQRPLTSEFEQKTQQISPLARGHGGGQAVRHQ